MQLPLLVWTSQKYQEWAWAPSAWKPVPNAWELVFPCKRRVLWWKTDGLKPILRVLLPVFSFKVTTPHWTEPCCSPSAWHVKRQSVRFLPETSPVQRPLNTPSHKDNYAEHHFSMLHILAGHKEQQLIPVITWESTKPMCVSCTSDHNLWLMLRDCLNKGWPVGRVCSPDTSQWTSSRTREIQSLPIIQPAKAITVNLSSETKSNLFNDSRLPYTRPINDSFGSPCLQSLM